jgi:aspartyl-tRNA synthetase
MIKHYALLAMGLLLSSQMMAGCSHKNSQLSKNTAPKSQHSLPQEAQSAAKKVFNTNTKLATEISQMQQKILQLENQISQTPLGSERAKLVKERSQLEERILALRHQQIANAKTFKLSQQKEQNQLEDNTI